MDDFAVGLLIGLCAGLLLRPLFAAWMWTLERKHASNEADVLERKPPQIYLVRPRSSAPRPEEGHASPGASGTP